MMFNTNNPFLLRIGVSAAAVVAATGPGEGKALGQAVTLARRW